MLRRRTPVLAAVNEHHQAVTSYGGDPQGSALIHAVYGESIAGIDGCRGYVYTGDHGGSVHSYHGDHRATLQKFTGAAALAIYGTAKPNTGGTATLDTAIAMDDLNDAGLRIFAARAARTGAWA